MTDADHKPLELLPALGIDLREQLFTCGLQLLACSLIVHTSKIEQAQEKMEGLRQELRTQVHEEVRSNIRARTWRRVLLRIGGCCGVYLLALLTIPLLVGYLIARTGFVSVPFLSGVVSHERSPSRIVTAVTVRPEEFLAARIRSVTRPTGRQQGEAVLAVSEGELTGLLRALLDGQNTFTPAMRAAAQVAIDADRAEVFARIPAFGGGETTLRIRGIPTVREGKFALDLHEVAIGSINIPRFIAQALLNSYIEKIPSTFAEGGRPIFALERVALSGGELQITLRVATP